MKPVTNFVKIIEHPIKSVKIANKIIEDILYQI